MKRIRSVVSEETRRARAALSAAREPVQMTGLRHRTLHVVRRRQGMALMLMLVALGIVSTICVGLLKMSLTERHQARREAVAAQAKWLAESGIDIAAALLKRDADAPGMTWNVSATELCGPHSAVVTVTIARIKDSPRRRQVTVIAEYPATNPQPIRRQIVRFVDL